MSVVSDTVAWLTDSAQWSGGAGIPARTLEHLGYTSLTVVIATAIAVPLGLWIGHTGHLRGAAVAVTGAMRGLPTLGLLTFIVLLMGTGLTPVTIALTVLAVPPVLAGAYAGVESVDPRTVDSARAMGMTEWQILGKVEVPLALPLIVGGIRSAVLQVVATATVAAYIGLGGLGRFVFDGIAQYDYPKTSGGAVILIVLALVLDGLFVGLQRLAQGGRTTAASRA